MVATSEQIANVARRYGMPGSRGAAHAVLRGNRDGMRNTLTSDQSAFVRAASNAPTSEPSGGVVRYAHPEATAHAVSTRRQPLTAAQTVWLSRLPLDPSKLPFDDARQVFRLLHSTNPKDPAQQGDLPLLRSVADPVRDFHDRAAAKADLALPLPPGIPDAAIGAMADAIANEVPGLTDDEMTARATSAVNDLRLERRQHHAAKVGAAQARIDQLDATASDRARVTRLRPDSPQPPEADDGIFQAYPGNDPKAEAQALRRRLAELEGDDGDAA